MTTGTVHYVQPLENDLAGCESFTFVIPGGLQHGISFPETAQLSMSVKMKVKMQEYADMQYSTVKGDVKEEDLVPARHGFHLGESLLGLNLFKRVDCYFRDFSYHVTADQCNSMSLSWLNKICVLEHSFNPLPELNTLKRSVGFVSGFHENLDLGEKNPGEGAFQTYVSLPQFPFRQFAPYSQAAAAATAATAKEACRVPPQVSVTVKLYKETEVPLVKYLALRGGTSVKTAACANAAGEGNIGRLVLKDASSGKNGYWEVTEITWEPTNVYLFYTKVLVMSKTIRHDFRQNFHAYRAMSSNLNTNSHQALTLPVDVIKTPQTLFIYFVRDVELNFRADVNTSVSPQYSLQPKELNALKLFKSSPHGPEELLSLTGLASRDPDPSWLSYLQYLKDAGFTRSIPDFWSKVERIPSGLQDRGLFNVFAFNLAGLKKESLQVTLDFLDGGPPTGWTLAYLFMYNCTARFPSLVGGGRSFEFDYA